MTLRNRQIKAFTLLESLVTLAVTAFLVLSLSGSVGGIFQRVEETLFFLSFEHLYRDTQKWSHARQENVTLTISPQGVTNGLTALPLPKTVTLDKSQQLTFNQAGGNSSLSKIVFETPDGQVTYQLYIGSGNYKKTRR